MKNLSLPIIVGLLMLTALSAGCSDLAQGDDATTAVEPTSTPAPTATAVTEAAEGIGRAFYQAWQNMDFAGMYSLLSPQSQALVDRDAFIELYQESMATATVQAVHTQPLAAIQEGNHAQMNVRVVWDTLLVGQIAREHEMKLVHNGGRWGVIWDEQLILPELEGGQRLHMTYQIPARANIYDRQGRALAYQGTAITLVVVPGEVTDEEGMLAALSPLLNESPEMIRARYATAQSHWRVPLGDVASEVLQEQGEELQPYLNNGLYTEQRLTRLYPENGVAPHLVGYVRAIPAEEVEWYRQQGYRGDEIVGHAGVEAWGEPYLRGERGGTLTIVGPSGEYIETVQETEPRQARSIYLTIDMEFQSKVEAALAEAVETSPGVAGSVVVLDVNTGDVLAMASYPGYNPAIFDVTRPDTDGELNAVLSDPAVPLLNRAAQGAYPSGSIFKVITLAAGLNSGLYTPESTYVSVGSWRRLGDNYIKRDWLSGGHGRVTMKRAITVSCNTCFYDMGYEVNAVDPYLLPATARQFGLGAPTGIEGIDEASGNIPDPDWKLARQGEGWAAGDAVNMAIGQGFVQVTPLQMVRLYAAIANGGTLYQPRLIDRLGAAGGAPEEEWPVRESGSLPYTQAHLEAVQEALWNVANVGYGTATRRFVGLP
ncbi:MAG: penicillin-binding transpeptidase domain-containing protein, partial [Candidatus Promineifilaceae bacterium]|nr:penicillin-binding transpeptidase domain-containing protein [Candidatus Promineifilaceae bacterium]